MQRPPFLGIVIIAAGGLALAVAAMVPPTDLKADWTTLNHPVSVAAPRPDLSLPDYASPGPPPAPAIAGDENGDLNADRAEAGDAARELRIADEDAAYGNGYAWAADREVDDRHACHRFRDARRDGCLDYVASLAPELPPEIDPTSG